ncbi:hypothetical protein ACFL9T_04160 [Thermodesulfobacteriota bacterium]
MEHREIALIGRLIAGMTHEMKNVLTIIKTSNGLMQDIMSLSKKASLPHEDKFLSALTKIQKHVNRGVDMMTEFNRFAHIMDKEYESVEANEFVKLVAFLNQRSAREKQVKLIAETTETEISIVTVPVRLLLALITCVDQFLEQAMANDIIALRPVQDDGKVSFQFAVNREPLDPIGQKSSIAGLEDMAPFLEALSGELLALDSPGVMGFSLVLPIKRDIP